VLQGHSGNDSLFGGGGDDSMDAWIGTNTLDGGGGHDAMYHRGGIDTISAGGGDDTVVVSIDANAALSSFTGGSGFDTLKLHFISTFDLDLSGTTLTGFESLVDASYSSGDDYVITLTTAQFSQFALIDLTETADTDASAILALADNADVVMPEECEFQQLRLAEGGQTADFREIALIWMPNVLGGSGNDIVFGPGQNDDVFEADLGQGNDKFIGGAAGEVVAGEDGKDKLQGKGGHDDLIGGADADVLDGGGGFNEFIYSDVSESTGTKFDTIKNFDVNFDEIIVPFDYEVVDPVEGGTLSQATFNDDLKAAIGKEELGIHEVVIFTPDAGDYAGQVFVIIEANDKKGYQKNADYVIRFDNPNFEFDGIDLFT
jgi:Ca2+-binding RTX toxin-like protein